MTESPLGTAHRIPAALTIAGSDPSGGAGIQADLKTFHRFGVYGEAAITLITVQNTARLDFVQVLDSGLVAAQIQAVLEDIPPAAVKTGALGSTENVARIADLAAGWNFPLIVDPIMRGKHGRLGQQNLCAAILEKLVPRAWLLMPNLDEASALTGIDVRDCDSMKAAAQRLREVGAHNVLIKGGHLQDSATDILLSESGWNEFPAPRIATRATHGAGCTYSAAITAEIARGRGLETAVATAKQFVQEAIRSAPAFGAGFGPLNHFGAINSI